MQTHQSLPSQIFLAQECQQHMTVCPKHRDAYIWAGSHFDISVSISINISITKICVNRDYISITVRMAIAPAQFTSRGSKMADYELEIGLLFLLSRRNRRRLLMQRQTQRKPRKVWVRDIFTRRKTQGDYYNLVQELKLGDREFYFR